MGRNASINIINNTQGDLTFSSVNVLHGKFIQDPPQSILQGNTGFFVVGNKTGAKIGPQGMLTYSTTQNGQTFDIIFTWVHPYSSNNSSYTCASNPHGLITATRSPCIPIGNDQTIHWDVIHS